MKASRTFILCLFSLFAQGYAAVTFSERGPDTAGEGFVTFTFKAKQDDGSNFSKNIKVLVKGSQLNGKMKIKASLSGGVFSATTKRALAEGTYKWRIKPKKENKSNWKTLTVTSGPTPPTTPAPTSNTPAPTPTSNTPAPTPISDDFIESAKADILALTSNNVPLKAKFLRLGFHDCVGGCDGCVSSNIFLYSNHLIFVHVPPKLIFYQFVLGGS
jgi:hypothetical protein